MGWWHDAEFNAYLDRFDERGGFNTHRRWTLWQLLRLVTAVEGDTAECGVYKGASSWLICTATNGQGRVHHLFDSFEGLSAPEAADGMHWKAGALSAGEDIVRGNLRPFADRLVFHKGSIPTSSAKSRIGGSPSCTSTSTCASRRSTAWSFSIHVSLPVPCSCAMITRARPVRARRRQSINSLVTNRRRWSASTLAAVSSSREYRRRRHRRRSHDGTASRDRRSTWGRDLRVRERRF